MKYPLVCERQGVPVVKLEIDAKSSVAFVQVGGTKEQKVIIMHRMNHAVSPNTLQKGIGNCGE